MKKITIITAFVSAVALVISGCSKHETPGHVPVIKNYIWSYVKPTKIFLLDDAQINENVAYTQFVYFIPLPIGGPSYFNNGEIWSSYMKLMFEDENCINESNKHFRRYDSLCVAHKDTEFSNAKQQRHDPAEQFRYATYRRMTLDITSDTQYDALHPVGTSLADIVIINIGSAKEVIESGYDESICGKGMESFLAPALCHGYMLKMPLKQFNEEYRKLVDCKMALDFPVAPDVTSTHRFTVTYRDEDGRVLTATAAPVTLQGKAN
ncbi:MAG: hypothetical protein IJ382_03210 [Flavobacteriales bacterium]|nr:hypothetical protein [Flavobacteriales bacterium]